MPLACGNTVILKASELSPATHRLIGTALRDAGFPDGVINVVTNAPEDAGKVVEYDPPRRLAYTFVNLSDTYKGEPPALATFVIEPYGKLVKLTLTHEGFAEGGKFLDGVSRGWPAILSGLKSLLETGKPLDVPYDAMKS